MRKLPPLTGLRAFEAAARHLNYSRAADDLNVTHAAISQQIRLLEDWFGCRLFERDGRQMRLTRSGELLAPDLHRAFDMMEEGTKKVLGADKKRPLQIASTIVFASRWLMPRLSHFYRDYPEIRLRLDSSMDLVDYVRDNIDLGIRYGAGVWPGLKSRMLIPGDRVPMCSPALLEGRAKPEKPEDILDFPLIHDLDHSEWEQWFHQQGISMVKLEESATYTMSMLAYQAAIEGHGMFMGVEEMAREDLEAGRLVMPLGSITNPEVGYYLVESEGKTLREGAKLFRDWLIQSVSGEKT